MSSDGKQYRRVAGTNEIAPGSGKLVEVAEQEIAVFNFGGAFLPPTTAARIAARPWPRDSWMPARSSAHGTVSIST